MLYYQHKYGGVYLFMYNAINKSNNDENMVVYKHVYPFEEKIYVRNNEEFNLSYRLLCQDELNILLNKDREEFKKYIISKK